MAHFCGHTHTRRDRREPGTANRSAFLERHSGIGSEPAGTSGDFARFVKEGVPARPEIEELAYSYWEKRGCQGGSDWEDWFRAERELRERGDR